MSVTGPGFNCHPDLDNEWSDVAKEAFGPIDEGVLDGYQKRTDLPQPGISAGGRQGICQADDYSSNGEATEAGESQEE